MARYKFQFWLNGDKDDELLVAETIDELKQRRSFSAVVRDGIMIVKELREGRVDLLLKLFPFVLDAIAERLPPPVPPTPPPMDTTDLLAEFRRMLNEQGREIPDTRDYGIPAMKPLTKGLPAALAMPVFDDDDDGMDTVILTKAKVSGNSETALAAMMKIAF